MDPATKPGVTNLLTIHSALSGRASRTSRLVRRPGYGALKRDLAEVVAEFVTPFRPAPRNCSGTPPS